MPARDALRVDGAAEAALMAKPFWKSESRRRAWLRSQLIRRHGGKCAGCGEMVNLVHDDPKQATIDHVEPLSRGGQHIIGNMQLLCAACNSAKGDTPPEFWNRYEEGER